MWIMRLFSRSWVPVCTLALESRAVGSELVLHRNCTMHQPGAQVVGHAARTCPSGVQTAKRLRMLPTSNSASS
ncbi:hypothetical protein GGX14DRAFT_210146 [Mycena pura]|uniref:Secreted protein n=1 Tax=Mycena pura TaxID=153505 RepID=A0AAD6Y1C4_9AGAR|nr:hypothetical protein GGX14DRAFT_210146 [Mycena pura]